MIPSSDPRCKCFRLGDEDCPAHWRYVLYTWELKDSCGIVRLAIDPECPIHEAPMREENESL
jgi:hypothetical protein